MTGRFLDPKSRISSCLALFVQAQVNFVLTVKVSLRKAAVVERPLKKLKYGWANSIWLLKFSDKLENLLKFLFFLLLSIVKPGEENNFIPLFPALILNFLDKLLDFITAYIPLTNLIPGPYCKLWTEISPSIYGASLLGRKLRGKARIRDLQYWPRKRGS